MGQYKIVTSGTRCEIKDIRWFDINSLPTSKTDQSCKTKLGLAPNSFFMVVPFLRDLKQWVKLKLADRLLFHPEQGRARRVSEREELQSPLSRVPTSGKISLKKSLSRPDSKQERVSPAKTPQPKSSRKQLFSVDSSLEEERSDTRRTKKSWSAEPSVPLRPASVLPAGFMPAAWRQFRLDKDLLLSLACSQG